MFLVVAPDFHQSHLFELFLDVAEYWSFQGEDK